MHLREDDDLLWLVATPESIAAIRALINAMQEKAAALPEIAASRRRASRAQTQTSFHIVFPHSSRIRDVFYYSIKTSGSTRRA